MNCKKLIAWLIALVMMFCACACAEDEVDIVESEATEVIAEIVPTEETVTSEPVIIPDPTVLPTEEPVPVSSYVRVVANTVLFEDASCTVRIGILRADAIMLLREETPSGSGVQVKVDYIDASGETQTAYFLASSVEYLPEDEPMTAADIEPEPTPIPEVTEAPTAEPTEVPVEVLEPADPKVRISMSYDTETLQLGSRVTLSAKLEGYEDLDYTWHWQSAQADADGNIVTEWQDELLDSLTFSYTLAEDNLLTAWRLCVTIHS